MHISEGILSGSVLIAGWAGSIAGISYGLKKTEPEKIVRTALISSAFFLASLVNVRIGPSSTHLTLLAPMGLILGSSVFPAVFVALLLQAVLFHFGGLLVLGVNTFVMAFSAFTTNLIFGKPIKNENGKIRVIVLSFMAGTFAVILGAFLAGAFLGLTDKNFMGTVKLLLIAHIPLALIEGFVTSFIVIWIKRVMPEFLS